MRVWPRRRNLTAAKEDPRREFGSSDRLPAGAPFSFAPWGLFVENDSVSLIVAGLEERGGTLERAGSGVLLADAH